MRLTPTFKVHIIARIDCQEVKLLYIPYCSCDIRRVKIGVVKNDDAAVRKFAMMYQTLDFRALSLLYDIKGLITTGILRTGAVNFFESVFLIET